MSMNTYPTWFDHHPSKQRLMQRYQRKATFIIGKDDPLVQPSFKMIDALDKPLAMHIALDRVNETIQQIFKDSDYYSLLSYGLSMGRKWLHQDITMTSMRPIILQIHGLTKSSNDMIINRHIHAIGQALSTYHCQDHLKGWYLYTFSAWFYQDPYGFDPLHWLEKETENLQSLISNATSKFDRVNTDSSFK